MANTTEFIWYQSPEIWAAIVAGIFALVTTIGTVLLYKKKKSIETKFAETLEEKKAELDRKNREIQAVFDTRLEQMRIEYGTLYQKRIDAIIHLHNIMLRYKDLYEIEQEYFMNGDEDSYNKNMYYHQNIFPDFRTITTELNDSFDRNKIYFSSEDSKMMLDFLSKPLTLISKISNDEGAEHSLSGYFRKQPGSSLLKEYLREIDFIQDRFRELVGVNL